MKPVRVFVCSFPLLLGMTGCRPDNAFVAPPAPKVTVQLPERREITTFADFTGRLEAVDTVEIRARVRGFLETIDFTPSQMVEEGDLLFTIESEPYEAERDAAVAERARLKASQSLATVTVERTRAAIEAGAASDLELHEVEAQLEAADAAILGADASIRAAEIQLDYTKITAPMDGRISRNLVSIGNLVGAGEATHLTTILVDYPEIYAYFAINERDLLVYLEDRPDPNEPREEQKTVHLELADGTQYEHIGKADFADNRVDTRTGSLQVRAVFPNPDNRLFPGLFARVKVPLDTGERFLVPGVAIQRDIDGSFILFVDSEGTVTRRGVTTGERIGTLRVITDGLNGDERVIVAGLQRARPGIAVDAQQATPAAAQDDTESTDTPAESENPADGGA